MDRSYNRPCPTDLLLPFNTKMQRQTWRVNGLMLANAIMVVIVGCVSVYAPRGRRHPLVHFLFVVSSTLFLPIISAVAATIGSQYNTSILLDNLEVVAGKCEPGFHIVLVLVWTGLVVVIAINTSAVVVGDEREGRNITPPSDLLIKALWLAYLMFSTTSLTNFHATTSELGEILGGQSIQQGVRILFSLLYALTACKLFQRYLACFLARRSVALGRNPRLIVGYMAQLGESHPPALIVKGEETVPVEGLPSGYNFKDDETKRNDLVTFDKVWLSGDGMPLKSKDLCFSFGLFKLLRCRFAKYSVLEAGFGKASKFFCDTYLNGEKDHERVFRVIADELSFIHDYYYSSLSVAFSNSFLRFQNIFVSVLSIFYSLYMFLFIRHALGQIRDRSGYEYQIRCYVWCPGQPSVINPGDFMFLLGFGNNYFDVVPVYLVLSVVVLSEIRVIVAYLCSNWTKVHLVCKYISNDSCQQCSCLAQSCIGLVSKYLRSRFVTHWDDKMSQCSVLMLHRPRRLLRLRDRKKKVKVPGEVKAVIFESLKGLTSMQAPLDASEGRGRDGALMHIGPPSLPISGSTTRIHGDAFSVCHGKGIADTLLAWHIATNIFEVKNQEASSLDPNKIAATHLSRYCVYLVAFRPELLPDDDKWCKSLYDDVKKDADRVLSSKRGQQLVELLSNKSEHEVVKSGVKLGNQLVESGTTWKALSRFWAEMILFIAPSENLDGHTEAIARGGELITLLWALLAHAGIVDRAHVANTANYDGGNRV